MAKKKKKLKKLSAGDLKKRRKKLKKRIKQAAKAGKTNKVSRLQKRSKKLKKTITKKKKNKLKQKAAKESEFFQTGKFSLKDIYKSEEYELLSPGTQKLIKDMVDSYSPEEIKDLNLTKMERKAIKNKAKKFAEKKYGKKSREYKELEKDYEMVLSDDINKLKTEQARAEQDLQYALEQNDSATAESLKVYQRTLSDTLETAKGSYESYVARKNDYLDRQITQMQELLETGLGRVSEDEETALRQVERQYSENLRNLTTNMAQMGYAYSGERVREEAELGEETEEMKTITSRDAERAREDYERQYGGSAQDWARRLTSDEIEELTRAYGEDVRGAIQQAESGLGTDAVEALIGKDQLSNLVGGQRGGINVASEQAQYQAETGYQRGAEERGSAFERQYGEEGFQQAFQSGYGGLGSYGGYSPTGDYGSKGYGGREYGRAKKDLKQEKRDYQQELYETLRQRKLGSLL